MSKIKKGLLVGCIGCVLAFTAHAFPPAPHHLIFGMVRDEMGDPISSTNAQIILQTLAGVQVKANILPGLEPGVNYQLAVPMDSGVTSDAYKPTALNPTVPFKIRVRIGQTTYLPIEMVGDFSQLGQPGKRTRLNLTLGEDSDGDGIPDAWERALIALTGGTNTLAGIRPGDDSDGDGLSNINEYIAGTFAFDNKDGFSVNLIQVNPNGTALLEFLVIPRRTYSIHTSMDLRTWTRVQFRIPAHGPTAPMRLDFPATEVRRIQAEVIPEAGTPLLKYFKIMLE